MWNAQQTVNSKSMLMFSFHCVGQDSLRLKWDYLEGLSTGYASTTPGLPPRSSVPQTESFNELEQDTEKDKKEENVIFLFLPD